MFVVLKYLCVYLTNKPIIYVIYCQVFKLRFILSLKSWQLFHWRAPHWSCPACGPWSPSWPLHLQWSAWSLWSQLLQTLETFTRNIKHLNTHSPLITILLHLITSWHSEIVLPMRISMSAIFSDSLRKCL